MLGRMQHFVDGFIAQCRKHRLVAELILVEWNPPREKPPLEEALRWPEDFGPATVRIVTVPPEVHAKFPHGNALPLFQMIGKNVGIRRARGRYVLATNIDILLDDMTVRYLRDQLRPGVMLRADRYDVPGDLVKNIPFDQVIAECRSRFFQINTRFGTYDVRQRRFVSMGDSLEARMLAFYAEIRAFGPVKPLRRGLRCILGAVSDGAKASYRWPARLCRLLIQLISAAARRSGASVARLYRTRARALVAWRDIFVLVPRALAGAIHLCPWAAMKVTGFLRRETPKIVPLRTMPNRGYWYVRRTLRRMDQYLTPRMPKPLRLLRAVIRWLIEKCANARTRAKSAVNAALMSFSNVWRMMRRSGAKPWHIMRRIGSKAGRFMRPVGFMRPISTAERLFALSRRLHTNACGDFTLLAREDWFRLRGYPEWPIFSWHIDSVFMFAANAHGIREMTLGPKCRIYHIDHSKGSGWSHDGAAQLFARLDSKSIPYLTNEDVAQLQASFAFDPSSAIANESTWGLADVDLPEREVVPAKTRFANADRPTTSRMTGERQVDTANTG